MSKTETKGAGAQSQRAGLQQTLVLAKPDAVHRGLVGDIIRRFETRGLRMVGLKLMHMDEKLASRLYEPHIGKPFYPPLVEYMTSGPIVAMVWEGVEATSVVRTMMGATNPQQAAPGTIRGDFA
ncbi:MAG: nucleoside-diphosphate kinase, partial [Candidatus Eremiobacterota bacterium]